MLLLVLSAEWLQKKIGGYENKKSIYIIFIPEIITSLTMGFLAFTKNFYVYNINLILFFCFISMENPVIQGYLLKTIPRSIKGMGVGFVMLISTFLGKIPGPIIYGILADKYEKKLFSSLANMKMLFFFGIIIIFLLRYFKIREADNEESNIIELKENIKTTMRTFFDDNDLFNIEMGKLNKRSNTFYKSKVMYSENKKIMLKPILSASSSIT